MTTRTSSVARRLGWTLFAAGVLLLLVLLALLRLTVATDYLNHALVKDPEREAPSGRVLVSPADGTVLYVKEIYKGVIPDVVKRGVPVPLVAHLKTEPLRPFERGYLIGIYMNTQGVHVNRIPNRGIVRKQIIFNGPHMNMTRAELKIIWTQMIPGLATLKKLLGMEPYGFGDDADFILQSARETLVVEDERGAYLYIVRIADYWVGKILTWVTEGEAVERGQRFGLISWGSQTDLFIEATPGLQITAEVGQYLYGGESVVATY